MGPLGGEASVACGACLWGPVWWDEDYVQTQCRDSEAWRSRVQASMSFHANVWGAREGLGDRYVGKPGMAGETGYWQRREVSPGRLVPSRREGSLEGVKDLMDPKTG